MRDSSHAFGLTVVFKDGAAHDVYRNPLHEAFSQNFRTTLWARVLVYDAGLR